MRQYPIDWLQPLWKNFGDSQKSLGQGDFTKFWRARNRSLIVNANVSITPKSSSVLMHQSFIAWYLGSFQFWIIKNNTVMNILK